MIDFVCVAACCSWLSSAQSVTDKHRRIAAFIAARKDLINRFDSVALERFARGIPANDSQQSRHVLTQSASQSLTQCITGRSSMQTPIRGSSILLLNLDLRKLLPAIAGTN